MRNRLHFQFQVELDILFTKLFNDITTAKGGAALVELMNVIRQASSELKERVVTAAEWFKSAAQLKMEKLPFDRVLEIATSTFQNINGKRENMDLILAPGLRSIFMPGNSVKPFTIAIINLLDNCYKCSGLGLSVKVQIYAELAHGCVVLMIQNDLNNDALESIRKSQLPNNDSRLITPNSSHLMRTEGGSGLVKAANQIASASERSTLHIEEVSGHTFRAKVNYVY